MLAAKPHLIRADLPGAPHARIDDRFRTASVGGPLRYRDQLHGLSREERQRDLTDAFDRQPRSQKLQTTGGIEIARPLDRAQQFRQFFTDARHRLPLLPATMAANAAIMACRADVPNRLRFNPVDGK